MKGGLEVREGSKGQCPFYLKRVSWAGVFLGLGKDGLVFLFILDYRELDLRNKNGSGWFVIYLSPRTNVVN